MTISIIISFMLKWVTIQKIYSKMYCTSCANTCDVTSFKVDGIIKNKKNWISQKWNMTFPLNKTKSPRTTSVYFLCRKRFGITFKDGICVGLCLELWFESNWDVCNIAESRWFFKSTVQKKSSKQPLPKVSLKKVTVQKSIAKLNGHLFIDSYF